MNPTERFSNRVENYRRYRPSYPQPMIELIRETAHLQPGANIADIGSGTGILTRLLLDAGWNVHAVEPNGPMRQAAEADLASSVLFHSIAASAEATGLPAAHISAITCAQAFHWFDREKARIEFDRILRPGGWVFLIWNERVYAGAFDEAYHRILETLGQAYEGIRDRVIGKNLESFFRPGTYREAFFANPSRMDWDTLLGRFLSSSYVPTSEDPRHPGLIADLKAVFEQNQKDGIVVLDQEARVYFGQV